MALSGRLVILGLVVLCTNIIALDRYQYEGMDRVMSEIYDQAEHTKSFISAWNKVQDLLKAAGGVGEHKEAKPENLRLRKILDCTDFVEEEKNFLFMRGLLCAAPGLLKVREQAEKFFLKIAYSHDWASALQRLWEVCRVQLMSSLDPIGVMQDEFPGGVRGWVTGTLKSVHREDIFKDLCDLFQKITENSVQVDSFFREGEAYALAKHIINYCYQSTFHRYEVLCHYAEIVGVMDIHFIKNTVASLSVSRSRSFWDRWGVSQKKVNLAPSQKLSWSGIATGLEKVMSYTELQNEIFEVLCELKLRIIRSITEGGLERCDDEGVVKRICSVFRERPDFQRVWEGMFRDDMLSESMQGVYANSDMTPLQKREDRASQQGVDFQVLRLECDLQLAFSKIESFGNGVVVQEYNRCVGMLQVAFPDLSCVKNPRSQEIDLIEFIALASCRSFSRHRVLSNLDSLLQDSLRHSWGRIYREWDHILQTLSSENLTNTGAAEVLCAMKQRLKERVGGLVLVMAAFPELKDLLKKYKDIDMRMCSGTVDSMWRYLRLS